MGEVCSELFLHLRAGYLFGFCCGGGLGGCEEGVADLAGGGGEGEALEEDRVGEEGILSGHGGW